MIDTCCNLVFKINTHIHTHTHSHSIHTHHTLTHTTHTHTHTHSHTRQVMRKSLNLRISNYQKLQERVATRTSYFFSYFLQQRDYDGKIKFDHNKEHLIIEVKVDSHTKKSQSTSNTKALSGGERSFSTVCFIMALWDAIQAPFRCLDEFDVFMVRLGVIKDCIVITGYACS